IGGRDCTVNFLFIKGTLEKAKFGLLNGQRNWSSAHSFYLAMDKVRVRAEGPSILL
ncbi:hypothetical protein AMECASPLE_028899, partial [Ameca splendens]